MSHREYVGKENLDIADAKKHPGVLKGVAWSGGGQ